MSRGRTRRSVNRTRRLRGGWGRTGIGRFGVGIDAASNSPCVGDQRPAAPRRMRGLGEHPTREQGEDARERHERDQANEEEREQFRVLRRPELGQLPERDDRSDERARHRPTPMRRLGQIVRGARATPRPGHMRNREVVAEPRAGGCRGLSAGCRPLLRPAVGDLMDRWCPCCVTAETRAATAKRLRLCEWALACEQGNAQWPR